MTREEALECLRRVAHLIDTHELAIRTTADLEEAVDIAIAALSPCACGGREPIARFKSKYYVSVDGKTRYLQLPVWWETTALGHPYPGKSVEAIILPAEEKPCQ